MTSGLKTRNPLVLFEGNDNAVFRPVARNPITQADVQLQTWTPKKTVERNPIVQGVDASTNVRPIAKGNPKPVFRNPIVADPNEFAVKGFWPFPPPFILSLNSEGQQHLQR